MLRDIQATSSLLWFLPGSTQRKHWLSWQNSTIFTQFFARSTPATSSVLLIGSWLKMCWPLPFQALLRLSSLILKVRMRIYLVRSPVFFGILRKKAVSLVLPTAFYQLDSAMISSEITPTTLNIRNSWGISTERSIDSTILPNFLSVLWSSSIRCSTYHFSRHSPTKKAFSSIGRQLKSSWNRKRAKLKTPRTSWWKDCSSCRRWWQCNERRRKPLKFVVWKVLRSCKTMRRHRSFGLIASSRKE